MGGGVRLVGSGGGAWRLRCCALCCLHSALCSLHDFSDAPKLSLDCRQARLSQPRTAAVSAQLQRHVVTGAGAHGTEARVVASAACVTNC